MLSAAMPFLGSFERRHAVVRSLWRFLLGAFEATGLIKVNADFTEMPEGAIVVSNHPTLIDVVIFVALVPKTVYVAKSSLLRNPFISRTVRSTALPDDETLPGRAADFLGRGWNVIIFPEGTRSPVSGLHPFKRGAANMALASGAGIAVFSMALSRRILGKRQKPWDMGEKRVVFDISSAGTRFYRALPGETRRNAAKRITEDIFGCISALSRASGIGKENPAA